MQDERYLRLLSEKFPNSQAVVTELINLRAILSLPKGTEHFVSDLHGESMAFIHMIKNASGVVRKKVNSFFLIMCFPKFVSGATFKWLINYIGFCLVIS